MKPFEKFSWPCKPLEGSCHLDPGQKSTSADFMSCLPPWEEDYLHTIYCILRKDWKRLFCKSASCHKIFLLFLLSWLSLPWSHSGPLYILHGWKASDIAIWLAYVKEGLKQQLFKIQIGKRECQVVIEMASHFTKYMSLRDVLKTLIRKKFRGVFMKMLIWEKSRKRLEKILDIGLSKSWT